MLPSREWLRADEADPKERKSNADGDEPSRETLLPRRMRLGSDVVLPKFI